MLNLHPAQGTARGLDRDAYRTRPRRKVHLKPEVAGPATASALHVVARPIWPHIQRPAGPGNAQHIGRGPPCQAQPITVRTHGLDISDALQPIARQPGAAGARFVV